MYTAGQAIFKSAGGDASAFQKDGGAIAASYLNGRDPMRLWQVAHRLIQRIQEYPAASLA